MTQQVTKDANLDGSEIKSKDMLQYEYARSALRKGMQLEKKLGTNPFKFGMIEKLGDDEFRMGAYPTKRDFVTPQWDFAMHSLNLHDPRFDFSEIFPYVPACNEIARRRKNVDEATGHQCVTQ